MPYIGGKVQGLVKAVAEVTPFTMRSLTDMAAEEWMPRAQRYTPVRSGAVRDAWQTTVVDRHGRVYTAHVQNTHWRAHFAEWGTGPHRIEPEDEQAITTPEGPRAGAMHPGQPGAHMLSRAALEVEAEFGTLA